MESRALLDIYPQITPFIFPMQEQEVFHNLLMKTILLLITNYGLSVTAKYTEVTKELLNICFQISTMK